MGNDSSLTHFIANVLLPALPAEVAYNWPGHNFVPAGDRLRGACPFHGSKSGTSFVVTRSNGLWWCQGCTQGGSVFDYRHRLNGGNGGGPRDSVFIDLAKELSREAGVQFPEKPMSPRERELAEKAALRWSELEQVYLRASERLWTPEGDAAREYLHSRGLTDETLREFQLGLAGDEVWKAADRGYVLLPWRDERGRPLTYYGRWPGTPPEGKPKTTAMPGEGTKRAPIFLDRVKGTDVVVVEGFADVLALRQAGEDRVVSGISGSLPQDAINCLARRGIKRAFICGDPDTGGRNGDESNVRRLHAAGIETYVVEELPGGMDPDEFVLSQGIDAWRKRVDAALPGWTWIGYQRIGDISWESSELAQRTIIRETLQAMTGAPPLDRERVLRRLAEATGFSVESILGEGPTTDIVLAPGTAIENPLSPPPGSCVWRSLTDILKDARPRQPIPTGFPELDKTFFGGGLSRGEAIALGGPPGSLKTTLSACLAAFMASPETHIGFAAFDEPEERVAAKIGSRFGEAFWRLNSDYPSVIEKLATRLTSKDIQITFVDPLNTPNVEDIMESFHAALPEGRTGILFLDHLHALSTRDASDRDNEFDTIRKVASAVARLTRKLQIITVSIAEVMKAASSTEAVRSNPLAAFAGTRKIASLFTVPIVCVPSGDGMELIIAKNRLGPRGSAVLDLNADTWNLTVSSVQTHGAGDKDGARMAEETTADDKAVLDFFATVPTLIPWPEASARLRALSVSKGRSLDSRARLYAQDLLVKITASKPAGTRGPAPDLWGLPGRPETLPETNPNPSEPVRN